MPAISRLVAIAALGASAAIAAPTSKHDAPACVVTDLQEYQQAFIEGPNECVVRPSDGKILLSRFYSNNNWDAINTLVPLGKKPFVFASGATKGDSDSCVQKFLQAGAGNTADQWNTLLNIGYTTDQMCAGREALADNTTLLVWEADANDPNVVLATWENVVPYMARLFDVKDPAVTVEVMKDTPYKTFANASDYRALVKQYSEGYCTNTYTNASVVQDAMADPTGVKFRAVLEACFSFFDVFMGNGYTYDSHTGKPGPCKEYLFPAREFEFIRDAAKSLNDSVASPDTGVAERSQTSQKAPARHRRRRSAARKSPLPREATQDNSPVEVLPLSMSIGKDYVAEETCPLKPKPQQ